MVILTAEKMDELWEIFKKQGEDAMILNHYELAERTAEKNPEVWKAFLMEPDVNSWTQSEVNLVQNSELKKIVKGAAKSRSVGQAQLMNALHKLKEDSGQKEGPIFVYTHVPLNNQQLHADNVKTITTNPFLPPEVI